MFIAFICPPIYHPETGELVFDGKLLCVPVVEEVVAKVPLFRDFCIFHL